MKKFWVFLLMFVLISQVGLAMYMTPGVRFDDTSWTYTTNKNVTDAAVEINEVNVSLGELYFNNIYFCDTAVKKSYFDTLRPCATPDNTDQSGGGGGGGGQKASGSLLENCLSIGGERLLLGANNTYVCVDENGNEIDIPDKDGNGTWTELGDGNETVKDENWIDKVTKTLVNPLSSKLYPQNPIVASVLMIIIIVALLIGGSGVLEYAKKDIGKEVEHKTILAKVALLAAFGLILLFFNFLRVNINSENWYNVGGLLWPSFPIGGWIFTGLGVFLIIWFLMNLKILIGMKKPKKDEEDE